MEANIKIKYLELCKLSSEEIKSLSLDFDYDDLISFCNDILTDKDIVKLEGIKTLLDIAVNRIWNKYYDDMEIGSKELNVFFEVLDLDNREFLNIEDTVIIKRFLPDDSEELKEKIGSCIHNLAREKYLLLFRESLVTNVYGNTKFNNLYNLMITLCHEEVHVAQNEDMTRKIDLNTFIMSLEDLVRTEKFGYYKENYDFLMSEIDANVRAQFLIYNFFKKHNLLTKEKLDDIEKIVEKSKEDLEKDFYEHKVLYGDKEDFASRQMFYICENSLKMFQFFFKYFPLLRVTFNDDGTMKTVIDLVRDKNKLEEENNPSITSYNDIYNYIFKYFYNISMSDAIEIEKKDSKSFKNVLRKVFSVKKK
ncbi:MAG: hypothetical protein IJN90_06845 [Bacilli bacterium]|nr:hypothetical protein [Bacilli bacterium]